MGKDKTKDRDAKTSTDASRDPSWDQESRDATLARTITKAVALQTQSIVEMFSKQKAEETQSITEAFTRQMEKTHT